MRSFFRSHFFRTGAILLAVLAGIVPFAVLSQVMQSTHYSIQSDSINVGGLNSTSTNYSMEDTVGEIGTGVSTSTNYSLGAGYQQMQEVYISITNPGNVTLSNINGLIGGTTTSSSTWTVLTDNPAGYSLTISAGTSPALTSGVNSFADYAPSGVNPDFTFYLAATSSVFAFSPQGADIAPKYKDNGSSCNAGSSDTASACWDGFSTSPKTIAVSATPNHPNGTATTVLYRAASGSNHLQPSGGYSATLTITASTL